MAETTALFETPAGVVQAILPHLLPHDPSQVRALEPCAGAGAIVRELRARGVRHITAVEVMPERLLTAIVADVFRWAPTQARGSYDLIITNPPFGLTVDLAAAMLPLLRPGGRLALLERLAFLSAARRQPWLRQHAPDVYTVTPRPSFVASGQHDRWDYAWFVWVAGRVTPGAIYHLPDWRTPTPAGEPEDCRE